MNEGLRLISLRLPGSARGLEIAGFQDFPVDYLEISDIASE